MAGRAQAVLQVVGVDVAPADDHHVLDAPGDVQLAAPQEAQVARAQPAARGLALARQPRLHKYVTIYSVMDGVLQDLPNLPLSACAHHNPQVARNA